MRCKACRSLGSSGPGAGQVMLEGEVEGEGQRREQERQEETGSWQNAAQSRDAMRVRTGGSLAFGDGPGTSGNKSSAPRRQGGGVRSCPRWGPWEQASREGSRWPREGRSGPSGELLCIKGAGQGFLEM